jgi:hypothetical protein
MEFEGIYGGNICNWKWKNLGKKKKKCFFKFFFTGTIDHAPRIILRAFMGAILAGPDFLNFAQ